VGRLERFLIVNADDFGRSAGINRGVFKTVEDGIVTSASLMVRWPAAGDAAAWARSRPGFGVGLHADLGEWVPRDDAWACVYEVAPLHDRDSVRRELDRQLSLFRSLLGRPPTHLDSHQHVHHIEPVAALLQAVADEVGIPLRGRSPHVRYCGGFYGQTPKGAPLPSAIGVAGLISLLEGLPAGTTELSCHPGLDNDVDSPYRAERSQEVVTLCDSQVRRALVAREITLCSFSDLPASSTGRRR
jgi:chitin disaccharide deacetylase